MRIRAISDRALGILRWFASRLPIFATAALFLSAAPLDRAAYPIRIRFEWGSEQPHAWAGLLETSLGTITQPASLGVDADEAGTLWADGKSLWLQSRTPRAYCGFDATVIAPPSAHLCITLQTEGSNAFRHRFEFDLAQLKPEPTIFAIKDHSASLSIRRAPGDILRVAVNRPHLIYRPGESFNAALFPDPLSTLSAGRFGAAALKWELCSPTGGEPLSRGSAPIAAELQTGDRACRDGLPVRVAVPTSEGSFDIHFNLSGYGPGTLEATAQILVLSDRRSTLPSARDVLVDSFRPGDRNPGRRIEGGSPASLGKSIGSFFPGFSAPDPAFDLSAASAPAVSWSAFRLRLKHPQQPHRLIVQISSQSRQYVGVSLLEPNAANQLMPVTLDTGVIVGPSSTAGNDAPLAEGKAGVPAKTRHEIVFWPRVSEPILLLHDMGTNRGVDVSEVEVHELASLAPAESASAIAGDARLVGPYLAKPLLSENFGALTTYDRRTGRSLDDWNTFHTAALRVAEYLRHDGDNSLMLAVLADGSTIYPSALLEPTPRYDTGCFFASGQDPIRKDFLELLYRVFDREGLVLLPELQFSCPLPVLERQLAGNAAEAEGIELVGRDGRTWRESRGSARGLAPYYNPLDPRVQNAVLDVVRELIARYRQHPSFEGIALEVSSAGYLQFPGLDWGFDDATVARFQRDTGVAVDNSSKDRYQRRYDVLCGEARSRWIRWRSQELAKFHRQLAGIVTSSHPHARLVLACKHVLGIPDSEEDVRREIRTRGHLGDLLPERGLDFSLLQNTQRLVVLRPSIWRTSANEAEALLDDAVNYNASFDSAFRAVEPGVLSYRQPRECRIADFDEVSPWRPAYTWVAVHISPEGRESRRRFVRALTSQDAQMMFDGGWMAALGQERTTRPLRQIARALPRVPFYPVELGDQPIVVRLARRAGKTYLYIANVFGEPVHVVLQLSCPAGTKCRPLGPSPPALIEPDEDSTSRLNLALDGYTLAAWEIDHEDVRVPGLRAELTAPALASVESQIRHFERQLASVQRASQYETALVTRASSEHAAKENDDPAKRPFEITGAVYWSVNGKGLQHNLDATPLEAEQAAKPEQSMGPLEFSRGPLLVKLRLRGDGEKTPARVTFEATVQGVPISRHIDVSTGTAWRSFEFHVEDLPAGSRSNARLRVEALSGGRIWADDVVVKSEGISRDDLRQLAKLSLELNLAWDEKRFSECQRLLDSYWGRYLQLVPEPSTTPLLLREAVLQPELLPR